MFVVPAIRISVTGTVGDRLNYTLCPIAFVVLSSALRLIRFHSTATMFDTWEAKFNEVKDWAIPEPGSWLAEEEGKQRDVKARKTAAGRTSAKTTQPASNSSGQRQKQVTPRRDNSSRDVGTASKARRPTNAISDAIIQPSCTDISTWSFLSGEMFLKEEDEGYSVRREPSVASTSSSGTASSGNTGQSGRSLLNRHIANGKFYKNSLAAKTSEANKDSTNGFNSASKGTVRPPSTPEAEAVDRLGIGYSLGKIATPYLRSPMNEDAPTEYAVRGSPSPTNVSDPSGMSSRTKAFPSRKLKSRREDLNVSGTTVDLDDSFSDGSDDLVGDTFVDRENFQPKSDFAPTALVDGNGKSSPGTESKRLLNILQSVRWLTAMHIIAYHFLANTGNNLWDNFASWGATQLTYFFSLSGFILAYQYTDRGVSNVGKFLFKRWARLYPTYLLSIIIQCIALPKVGIPVDAGALVAVLFSLTTWIPRYFLNHINTPGWSVGAFLFQYLLFPSLLKPISLAKQETRFKKLLPACWIFSILEAGHGTYLVAISAYPRPFVFCLLLSHSTLLPFALSTNSHGHRYIIVQALQLDHAPAAYRQFHVWYRSRLLLPRK